MCSSDFGWVVQLLYRAYEMGLVTSPGITLEQLRATPQFRQTDPGSWVAGTRERWWSLESVFSVVLLYRGIQ